jgi:hypothetical protein
MRTDPEISQAPTTRTGRRRRRVSNVNKLAARLIAAAVGALSLGAIVGLVLAEFLMPLGDTQDDTTSSTACEVSKAADVTQIFKREPSARELQEIELACQKYGR